MLRTLTHKLHSALWTSKRRKILTMVSTVSLVVVSAAAAYYLLSATGTGSQSQTLGTVATQPVTITV